MRIFFTTSLASDATNESAIKPQKSGAPSPPSAYKEALRRWLDEEVDGRRRIPDLLDDEIISPRVLGI